MRILALMKRFSSNKDQILESFGREIHLLTELQKRGHSVTVLCADHTRKERATTTLNGMKIRILPFGIVDIPSFLAEAKKTALENDILIGTSHPLFGLIAVLAAGRKPVVYDIRDNYETYDLTNIPLLKTGPAIKLVNNYVIRHSKLASCASPELARMTTKIKKIPTVTVPNGIDLKLYRPLSKEKCRKMLGLPVDKRIITYSGGIRGSGVDLLIKAFGMLTHNDLQLMLIGNELTSRYGKIAEASNGKIMVVSSMPYKKLLYYLNASDALVVAYEKNSFTQVMYAPYKLMDYMAVNKPIICADIGEMRQVIKKYDNLVYEPGNAEDLASKIIIALGMKKTNYRKKLAEFTWEKLGEKLDNAIKATFKNAGEQ